MKTEVAKVNDDSYIIKIDRESAKALTRLFGNHIYGDGPSRAPFDEIYNVLSEDFEILTEQTPFVDTYGKHCVVIVQD